MNKEALIWILAAGTVSAIVGHVTEFSIGVLLLVVILIFVLMPMTTPMD